MLLLAVILAFVFWLILTQFGLTEPARRIVAAIALAVFVVLLLLSFASPAWIPRT